MNSTPGRKFLPVMLDYFKPSSVLITGAAGFVGRALVQRLLSDKSFHLVCASRSSFDIQDKNIVFFKCDNCIATQDWKASLSDIDVVVHLAARVHRLDDRAEDSMSEYRSTNVIATLNLARQASIAGVRRFIFISSIKVNGKASRLGLPFSDDDVAAPLDPYGVSKMEAENGLREVCAQAGMELVIIRPPLVYGSGVKANFAALMSAVQRGWPLPLGAVYNQRSLVALDNLVDFIITCITHPQAANEIFLVSDGQDLSTTELVRYMAQAAKVPARLLPVPVWALQAAASLLGKGDTMQRLCGNLQVDISKARNVLGWVPPVSVEEGLKRAMAAGDGIAALSSQ